MPVYGDTTTGIANFSEVINLVNQVAQALELEYAVMGGLVQRREIPRGQDRVRLPYQTETFTVDDYTDGDEVSISQQMGIDTIDLTTSQLLVAYRISDRAMRFPAVDLAALAGQEQAKAIAEALEARLLALSDDTGSQDLGASAAATTLAHFRTARRLLRNVSRLNGGGAPAPWACVLNPFAEEDLLEDLGVTGAAATTGGTNTIVRSIPNFLEKLFEIMPSLDDAFVGTILRVPVFVSGYIGETVGSVTTPSINAFFSTKVAFLGVAKDWDTKFYDESDWPGLKARSMSDYGVRLGPFPQWMVQFDTAIS